MKLKQALDSVGSNVARKAPTSIAGAHVTAYSPSGLQFYNISPAVVLLILIKDVPINKPTLILSSSSSHSSQWLLLQ